MGAKFGLKIPNRFGKMSEKNQMGRTKPDVRPPVAAIPSAK